MISKLFSTVARCACAALLAVVLSGATGCNVGSQNAQLSGRQAFDVGNYSQAINQFQQAVNRNPRDADSLYNLAASYVQVGKQQKNSQYLSNAEQLYRQSIASNPQHVAAHRGLSALLIETGREQYAFDLLKEWQTRSPQSAEPLIELARLYQEYGDNRHATDMLADAIKVDNNNIRALKAMGRVRELQGQSSLALDNYYRVLQLDNQQTDVAARVNDLRSRLAQNPNDSATPSRYGATQPWQAR